MTQIFPRKTKSFKLVICQSCEEQLCKTNIIDFGCIHNFCKCCAKAVFTHQIREGRLNQLKCLNSTCYIVACKALVQRIVNEETFQLYNDLVTTGTGTGSNDKNESTSKKHQISNETTNFNNSKELLAEKAKDLVHKPPEIGNYALRGQTIKGTNDTYLPSSCRRPELSHNTEHQTDINKPNEKADMENDERALFEQFKAFMADKKIGSKSSCSGLAELSEHQTKTNTGREFSDQAQHQPTSGQTRTLTPDLQPPTSHACPKSQANLILEPKQSHIDNAIPICEHNRGLDGGCSERAGNTATQQPSPIQVKQTASEFDCTICMSTIKVSDGIDFGCGHKFCSECMKSYFETKINDRVTYGYTCPAPKCEVEADHSMIRRLLDNTSFQKYDEILLDEAIARDMPEIVTCPNVNCQKRVYADEFGYCEACDYRFCTECSKAYHGISPCGQTEEERRADMLGSNAAEGVAHGVRNNAANYELPPLPLGYFNTTDYEPEVGVFSAADYEPDLPLFNAADIEAQIELFAKYEQERAMTRSNTAEEYHSCGHRRYNTDQHEAERLRLNAAQEQADFERLRNNTAQRRASRNERSSVPESNRIRSGEQREQEARRRQRQEARSDRVIRRVCKQCPNCRTNIEKDDGCNHMECARCGTHFCWICLERLNRLDPYAHFQLGRCDMA